jgi:Predicted nucleic-acid-binding protein containing a Zn-ribbon
VSGNGILHSFAVHRVGSPTGFEDDLPYAVGVVKLDEDVQLLARLWPDADGDWDAYTCDAPVVFRAADAEEVTRRPVAWFGLPG